MASRTSNAKTPATREEVLALDIATHCGFFSLHGSGTWNFTESLRRNGNKMHKGFPGYPDSLHYGTRYPADRGRGRERDGSLLRHAPPVGRAAFSSRCAMSGPARTGIRQRVHPEEVGHGRREGGQGQDDARVCRALSLYPQDDNAADACHLFYYYLRKYRI